MNIAAQMMLAPAWRCSGRNNDEMVDRFVEAGLISSKEVEDAFRAIPRGAFVPGNQFDEAYFDSPLRGDPHVHLSAPHMYATVLEALDLCPGLSFLNIGSGTGYFSCLAGYLIKRNSINHGVEQYEDLVEYCQERCDDFMKYSPSVANEMSQPVFLVGNCFRLDHRDRQYDRVYCGAACLPTKVSFVLSMVKVGGFAIMPCKNKLLRINRVSPTSVKQSVIREVSFSPLANLPSSEESQPKLKFPPVGEKKKEKTLKVYPPSNLLISNGPTRKTLARLRSLQEASECLQSSESLPLPFCYVPDQQQLKELKNSKKIKKATTPQDAQTSAAVDCKIAFFNSCSAQPYSNDNCDKWDFINNNKLWETVMENYYSVCSVSNVEKNTAMLLYVKRKTKKHLLVKNPSYSELMTRLGLPVYSVKQTDSRKNVINEDQMGVEQVTELSCDDENRQKTSMEIVENIARKSENEECKREAVMLDSTLNQSQVELQQDVADYTAKSSVGVSKRKAFKERRKIQSSEMDKKKSGSIDILLEVDNYAMKKLTSSPKKSWCLDDDKELVRFLSEISHYSSKGRCKGWFKPELVRPSLFSRIDSLAYPRLSSVSAEDLAYRTVGLCRVANILDSSLHLLIGSSLLNECTFVKRKYPMNSFNESSFESPRNSSQVTFKHLPVEIKRTPREEPSVYAMMDADQLRIQLELTSKKLKLTQELQEQIKEQQKVLRKQASLLEEKQILIQNLSSLDIHRHSERTQTNEQQLVVDLKMQRQDVLSRIQTLSDQYALQETKKSELVEEIKQVKEERNRILEFESRTKETQDSLQTPAENNTLEETKTTKTDHVEGKTSSSRYQIADLLPHLRFLLPLCRQRWRLVQEMLHASECSAPDHLPIVTVDRRTPLSERGGHTDSSVLLQVFKELKPEGLNYRWNKWKYDQWWEVKFVGEGIIDQGGGFRDSLVEIADEICPPEKNSLEVLPFFIRTPNNKDGVGDYQDVYVPNPLSKQWHIFEWIGKLFGAAYRTDENITVSCPPFFWKLLVGEHVTWAQDYADIDESLVRFTDALETADEDLYDAAYGVECTFSTVLSDGSRVDLVPGGREIHVKSDERQKFASLLRQARMTESVKQVLAIRKGLISVVPETVLQLLTWAELERGVCGNPDVSVSVLKNACKYGDNLSESTDCIKHLWSALSKFTNEERSKFLRFVTGRRRPPSPFTVVMAGGTNELPNASTCASSLFWPNYSSEGVAIARLRYAIYNCIAIDTDTSPW